MFWSSEFPEESQEKELEWDRLGVVLLGYSVSQASYMRPVISFEFQNKRNRGIQRRKCRECREQKSDRYSAGVQSPL